MKKFICIVLTVVLALSCMSAFAAEPLSSQEGGTTTQESITPFWVNTLSIIPSISGSAGTYSCSINGVSGTTKISATLVLYEKGWLGGYTEVARTSHTTYSASFFKSDSYSFSSGKTYKLEVSGTVTRNGYAEPVSATIIIPAFKSFEEDSSGIGIFTNAAVFLCTSHCSSSMLQSLEIYLYLIASFFCLIEYAV